MLTERDVRCLLMTLSIFTTFFVTTAKDELPKSIVADDNPFRTARMNFIWSKAIHHLSDKVLLKSLKKQLFKFDELYLSAKDASLKHGDKSFHGLHDKLDAAMKEYGLDGIVAAYEKKVKWKGESNPKKENNVLTFESFADPKLEKLWQTALSSRFAEYQLKDLLKQLRHYEERENEYHELLADLHKKPHENSLDGHDDEDRTELNLRLKTISRQLTDYYDKLHEKIVGTSDSAFRNAEVDTLWRMAVLDSNFTEAELESIRVELSHFDKQMDKLHFHEKELEIAKESSVHGKKVAFDEHLNDFEDSFLKLKRKLKKLKEHLESRIRHTEL